MEEKKRVRPTLTQVRALEAKIAELEKFISENTDEKLREKLESQIDGTSMLVKDCYGWRDKFRTLKKQFDDLAEKEKLKAAEYKKLEEKYENQLRADKDLAEQVKRLKSQPNDVVKKEHYDDAVSKLKEAESSNNYMKNELTAIRAQVEELENKCAKANSEVMRLKNRTLLERIFNA